MAYGVAALEPTIATVGRASDRRVAATSTAPAAGRAMQVRSAGKRGSCQGSGTMPGVLGAASARRRARTPATRDASARFCGGTPQA